MYVGVGGEVDGPMIAVGILVVCVAAMGLGLLVLRTRVDAKIGRILRTDAGSIARVFPKQTESSMRGETVARYTWIVLQLRDGSELDVYASSDFARVLEEIRRHAPDAEYDPQWRTERLDLR